MEKKGKKEKVYVGMSGGVDSSVAAVLLLEQGYDVVGAFMKNWSDTKDPLTGECTWRKERRDAMAVAAHLGIPFETFDFEDAYRERVTRYMFDEYAAGRTPNPDVLCNSAVKFDLFLKRALEMGADYVATGHYARVYPSAVSRPSRRLVRLRRKLSGAHRRLLAGVDADKDQSYFVFRLGQEELRHVLFPVGGMTKPEVREKARALGLPTAEKKDSQGICFIGKVELKEFLARGIEAKPGPIVTVEGEEIGRHDGIHHFTIGQRHGLGIGGGIPYYVVSKDVASGTLTVAKGEDHPALFRDRLVAGDMTWVAGSPPELPFRCRARIRYRQPLQECEVRRGEEGSVEVRFDEPQRAVAPGQFIVLYDEDPSAPLGTSEVLGGGVICE